jgi:hypothetical protein|tara:strand:- start:22466 stop:22870 length:405 start_codon:yes stop_codon:yes gene_type:complete
MEQENVVSNQEIEQSNQEVEESSLINEQEMDEPVISSIVDDDEDEDDDDEEDYDEQDGGSDMDSVDQKVAIDLSDNEFYKGLCTLLEDEHGNNILEYISLLHTELIGMNKNLRTLSKNMSRMANCAEIMAKKSS